MRVGSNKSLVPAKAIDAPAKDIAAEVKQDAPVQQAQLQHPDAPNDAEALKGFVEVQQSGGPAQKTSALDVRIGVATVKCVDEAQTDGRPVARVRNYGSAPHAKINVSSAEERDSDYRKDNVGYQSSMNWLGATSSPLVNAQGRLDENAVRDLLSGLDLTGNKHIRIMPLSKMERPTHTVLHPQVTSQTPVGREINNAIADSEPMRRAFETILNHENEMRVDAPEDERVAGGYTGHHRFMFDVEVLENGEIGRVAQGYVDQYFASSNGWVAEPLWEAEGYREPPSKFDPKQGY